MSTETNDLQEIAKNAFATVPNMYANGFINGAGASDMYVVFQLNGQSTVVLNMTPTLAKTLGQSLTAMVKAYEEKTDQTVSSSS